MKRLIRVILLALLGVAAFAMPASAAPNPKLGDTLGQLWTTVLETPAPQNSFGTGSPATACWDLGGTVAPLGPNNVRSCTVKPETKIFESKTSECSTFKGDTPGKAATERQLRDCARSSDVKTAPRVTVDGRPICVTATETPLLHITLPANNIFGLPAGTRGLSVAHGWVALLNPLTPGTHTIVSRGTANFTTKIVVRRGA
jgi:hypothetical protein